MEPTVNAPDPAKGPWQWVQLRVLLPLGLAALIVLVAVVHFTGALFSGPKESAQETAERKATQQYEQTIPPNPSDVAGFGNQTTHTATSIGQSAANASNLAHLLAQGNTNPLAVPGNPQNTDPRVYKAWADADASTHQANLPAPGGVPNASVPNEPTERASAVTSSLDEKREAARKREQQRLMASSIAIDFTKQTRELNSQPLLPEQMSQPSAGPPLTPVSARAPEASKGSNEPRNLQAHTCVDLCEGDLIETVLTNLIDGSQAGFADVMVTQPVFSHDWDPKGRRLLIPVGSRVLGNVTAVNSAQAQRLFVAFHKLRRPDGSTFSLDNFTGLDMAGAAGLRDLVNNHYLRIFGVSGAIAAIGAVAQIGNSTNAFSYDPGVALRNGLSQELGQQSTQILNRFLNQPPTMTVREGKNLVKVYISQDLTIPEYSLRKEWAYAQ